MRTRFGPEIDRLRVALQRRAGQDLLRAVREAIESIDGAVLVANSSGRYVAVNRAAVDLTGYSRDELLSMGVVDLTPVPDVNTGARLWAEFVAAGAQRGTYILHAKGGRGVPVKYWAFANVAPGIHVSVLVVADPAADDERREGL